MKKVTRWSPDTCGCVIDYEWDTEDPPDKRNYAIKEMVRRCVVHSANGNDPQCFGIVLSENRLKNRAVELLIKSHPYLKIIDLRGREYILPGLSFSFDDQRVLHLEHKALKAEDKIGFQETLDTDMGNNRVKLK